MAEEERHRAQKEEDEAKMATLSPQERDALKNEVEKVVPFKNPETLIRDPNYTQNPQQEDKEQVKANMVQFMKSGKWLWGPTRTMYEFIKNELITQAKTHAQFSKHIWKPHVVDVGCGSGVGTNVLSWESDFAWGIDKNKASIQFAHEVLRREKNGIYYSPQLSFDVVDIMEDTREMMQFDVVVAIEVIEHIDDWKKFMRTIINNFAKRDKEGKYIKIIHHGSEGAHYQGTLFYISTPNRNNPKISDEKPKNKYHVREVTSEEFRDQMETFFNQVQLLDVMGAPVNDTTVETPLLAKCYEPR